jgi:hypothetical protein
MKTKYIFIAILMVLLYAQTANSEHKTTYWVHGMGGDGNSLYDMSYYFGDQYDITTHLTNYRTDLGIVGSAEKLLTQIGSNTSNIIIAHSMGGVNSIELWRNHKIGYIGGLITLASPLNGAYIANNIDNGIMTNLSQEVVEKGMKGTNLEPNYIAAFIFISPWVGIISTLCGEKIYTLKKLLTFMSEKFLSKAASDAVQSDLTKNSLKVGSTEIKNIQNSQFNLPSIQFAGSEDYPALLRFVSSRMKIDAVGLITQVYIACEGRNEFHNTLKYAALACLNFPAAALHNELASAWKTSADYWNGQFQHSTDVFIGAYRVNKYWITYTDLECPVPLAEKSTQSDPICKNPVFVQKQQLITEIITEPNDGIVPFNSQQMLPGCLKTVTIEGINHEEMKTHDKVRTKLNEVFLGNTYTDRNREFFKLTKK